MGHTESARAIVIKYAEGPKSYERLERLIATALAAAEARGVERARKTVEAGARELRRVMDTFTPGSRNHEVYVEAVQALDVVAIAIRALPPRPEPEDKTDG